MSERFKICRTPPQRMQWLRYAVTVCTHLEIKVAVYLADSCNGTTGQCNPKQATIAKDYGMSRNNVGKAIVGLRDKKIIRCQNPDKKVKQWDLILPVDKVADDQVCASLGKRKIASVEKHKKSGVLITVVEPVKNKPKTQSPTLHGARTDPNPWEAWGPDLEQVQYFLKNSGLTNSELDDEVQEFIDHNIAQPEKFEKQGLYWKRWCRQISKGRTKGRRDVNDTGHIDVTGQHRSAELVKASKSDVAKLYKQPPECWKRVGPHVDPSKYPDKFVAQGCCSRDEDPCTCEPEQRKDIVERLKQCPKRR